MAEIKLKLISDVKKDCLASCLSLSKSRCYERFDAEKVKADIKRFFSSLHKQ